MLLMGLACATLLAMMLVWWRLSRIVLQSQQETSHILSDITAIAQTIAAQNRELLRRSAPAGDRAGGAERGEESSMADRQEHLVTLFQRMVSDVQARLSARQTALRQAQSTLHQGQRQVEQARDQEEQAVYTDEQLQEQSQALIDYCQSVPSVPPIVGETLTRLSTEQAESATKRAAAREMVQQQSALVQDAESRVRMLQDKEQHLQQQLREVREHLQRIQRSDGGRPGAV